MQTENELINEHPHRVDLFLLGCQLRVHCKYENCAKDIREYFPHAVQPHWSTPDIQVFCDWERAGRYLFRSRPEKLQNSPLKGVYTQLLGGSVHEWTNHNPPLPPFVMAPLRDRFVGLHAGAVVTDNNQAMLFIGPSGSGKTTSTSVLVNSHSCHLLTDETVFIHRRTSLVEPFHREIRAVQPDPETGVLKKKSIHVDVFYDSVYTQPVPATHGVFLEPGSYAGIRPIYPAEALKRLIDNHLYLGCDYDEALVTLGLLAKDLSFVVLNYKTYDQLISMAPQTLKIHRQQKLV